MNTDASSVSQVLLGSMSEPRARALAEPSFRRGSLPFKKRKLYRTGSSSISDISQVQSEPKSPYTYETPNVARPVCFGENDDEKIAALALVAAASSTLPVSIASFPGLVLSPVSINQHNMQMHVIQDESARESPASNSSSELSEPHQTPVAPSTSPITKLKTRIRVQHPPLRAPLPGGCHGRTARNNSYCRRHPCYNGSKYCKLHYQMHVVSGMRPQDSPSASSSSGAIVETSGRDSPLSAVRTDKRFQGLDGEVKCSATTTRGRPCSYISVNGTGYCYLHADYDSNPPLRRGGNPTNSLKKRAASIASSVTESASGDETASILLKTPNKPPASVTSDESSLSSSAWVTPQVSSVSDTSTYSEGKIKDVSMRDGKPVLSSLSYDQWFDKKVSISTGPLSNHTGRVVKWGNGWVTVRVAPDDAKQDDEGLLHNRRAVELFLIPEEEAEEKTSDDGQGEVLQEKTNALLRCVSREIDASPSETGLVMSRQNAVSPIEHSGSQANSGSQADARESIKHADETFMDGDTNEKKLAEPCDDRDSKLALSRKQVASPHAAKSTRSHSLEEDSTSIPLAASLLLAQEQGFRKQGTLLFGTAALERGRRRIHKPARYEDTAMLEKPRSRLSTPVSSPRSPRK